MNTNSVIRVPGKIMLAGEYAVLFGERALAFAIDSFLEVQVRESEDGLFHVRSDIWSEELHFKSFSEVPENRRGSPLILALLHAQEEFRTPPLHIQIRSEMDLSAGMGTSSAVILACCFASSLFSKELISENTIAKLAYTIQKNMQGHASGYDVLTQCKGGLVTMRCKEPWPSDCEKNAGLENVFEKYIHPFAGGKGSATAPLLKETLRYLETSNTLEDFLSLSSDLTDTFLNFFKEGDLNSLIQVNRKHRDALSQFPHFPTELAKCLQTVAGCDERWTFKTTGAGGEDSILLIGAKDELQEAIEWMKDKGWYPLNCKFTSNGIRYDL